MSDIALEGFRVVLEATRDLPAVPFLHEAASIALRILNIASVCFQSLRVSRAYANETIL